MKIHKLFLFLGAVFGGIGVVLAVVAVSLLVHTVVSQADDERTTGTVTALVEQRSTSRDSNGRHRESTTYHPKVRFEVDGRTYTFTSSVGANPPAYQVGDSVPVLYDPADPAQARLDTFAARYLAPIICGGIGVVFLGVAAPLFVVGVRRRRRETWLRSNGSEVWADVAEIGVDFSTRINGRHPYVVHVTWRDAGSDVPHAATSDPLFDPERRLGGRRRVRVLYDPADPNRNMVDLDAVPPG